MTLAAERCVRTPDLVDTAFTFTTTWSPPARCENPRPVAPPYAGIGLALDHVNAHKRFQTCYTVIHSAAAHNMKSHSAIMSVAAA